MTCNREVKPCIHMLKYRKSYMFCVHVTALYTTLMSIPTGKAVNIITRTCMLLIHVLYIILVLSNPYKYIALCLYVTRRLLVGLECTSYVIVCYVKRYIIHTTYIRCVLLRNVMRVTSLSQTIITIRICVPDMYTILLNTCMCISQYLTGVYLYSIPVIV